MIRPSESEFLALAHEHPRVPVHARVLADGETPITLFTKVRQPGRRTFLLESVEGPEQRARYSFVGADPVRTLSLDSKGHGKERDLPGGEERIVADPLGRLTAVGTEYQAPVVEGLPPFAGGAVGCIAYQAVSLFEDIELPDRGGLSTPLMLWNEYETVHVFDHREHTLTVVTNPRIGEDPREDYARACHRLRGCLQRLHSPAKLDPLPWLAQAMRAGSGAEAGAVARSSFSREDFMAAVQTAREYIEAGEIFQVVLSQRLELPLQGVSPLDVYRVLRVLNPSPYMYFLDMDDFLVLGTSPEALVKVDSSGAETMPIAGTRPRGRTPDEDAALAAELLADPKENAEHVMLVDLGRNDLGRISRFGTVRVTDFRTIERYSHVMHIVSRVRGTPREDVSVLDVLGACFPAGTVSGAPKIRAMEIIEELEPVSRGLYAGAIGYVSYTGCLDSCIAIRTMVIRDDVAYLQAGAGIVADSEPDKEYEETLAKARALASAVGALRAAGA